jgi:hypothetical protein
MLRGELDAALRVEQAPSDCTNADRHKHNGFVLPEIVPCEGWTHYAKSAEEASGRSAGAEPILACMVLYAAQ